MKKLKVGFLCVFVWFSCDTNIDIIEMESCDYSICDEGRNITDTILGAYGILRIEEDISYIEYLDLAPVPDTFYIACMEHSEAIPESGNYVKFDGYVKDPCGEGNENLHSDSLFLTKISTVAPEIMYGCDTRISTEEIDKTQIDGQLNILNLSIEKNCISILISYQGGCTMAPEFSLHMGGDVLGGTTVVMAVQDLVADDCDEETIKLLKYDLSPIGEIIPIWEDESFMLFFQRQGNYRLDYPHTYN
jgi:hypothetical protein